MPIYEYRCAACGERFETLVPRHDAAPPPCSHCGSDKVERLLSAFAVTSSGSRSVPGPCGTSECACRRGA